MIGGQQNQEIPKNEQDINPQKQMEIEEPKPDISSPVMDKISFSLFRDISKDEPEIFNAIGSNNYLEGQNEQNGIAIEQQESRPSPPIDQSVSQSLSHPKDGKIKNAYLTKELIRLTKKSTNISKEKEPKQRERKVRCYVTNFEPYLPAFLDEIHREHHKNIIRIGQNYQAYVPTQPSFESIHRPLNHLRIWRGSQQKVNKQALKKFREIYGDNRTEEELILLKHRLQLQNWDQFIKEMTLHCLPGKKSTLVIASNTIGATTTRNK